MSAESPICMGCLINSNWYNQAPPFGISIPETTNKTDSVTSTVEQEILLHLAAAWNKFKDLSNLADHDLREFNYAIHLAQQKIALRVVRRVDSLIWRQPDGEVKNESESKEGQGTEG